MNETFSIWLQKKQDLALVDWKKLPEPTFRKGLTMYLQNRVTYLNTLTPTTVYQKEHENILRQVLFSKFPANNRLLSYFISQVREITCVIIPSKENRKEPLIIKRKSPLHHLVIVLEEDACAHIIDESCEGESAWQGTEFFLAKGSDLTYSFSSATPRAFLFSPKYAQLQEQSSLHWVDAIFNARTCIKDHQITLAQEGSQAKYASFSCLAGGDQGLEETSILHQAPRTTSHMQANAALFGQSKAIIQGKIVMTPKATGGVGSQDLSMLTMQEGCVANAIPLLEIENPDVKCSHAARITYINPEQLFYLSSRGIVHQEGERLIVEGFYQTLFEAVPHMRDSLIHYLEKASIV